MSGRSASVREEWTRQLNEGGLVEFAAGRRLIARVNADGVALPTRDLLVRWMHLGFADGHQGSWFPWVPSALTLTVSRPWWARHIAASAGIERFRAKNELSNGWARPTVLFSPWFGAPVEAFGEWVSEEAVARAPIPDRFCLTPSTSTSVLDRDTNRPVPLDRLPIGDLLRERLAAWGAAAGAVPDEERAKDETWARFLPEGRALAADLQGETGRLAAAWADCPDMP